MSNLLIPFGIHRESGLFIEPEDAPRGRACNCLCPGCKAPVLSRHPRVNRIHFAHDSKHDLAEPDDECPFNSAAAVAMMIRELAKNLQRHQFHTPALYRDIHFSCCSAQDISVSISKQSVVTIESAEVKNRHQSHQFDLCLHIGKHLILVDLVYKGKPPIRLDSTTFDTTKSAVLEIDCDMFAVKSFNKERDKRFSVAVMEFLLGDDNKKWRHHPKENRVLQVEKAKHQCTLGDDPVTMRFNPASPAENKYGEPRTVICQLCRHEMIATQLAKPAKGYRCAACK